MSMDKLGDFIWQNGRLVKWGDAKTHVLTHSLHYGMSVFEGLRSYENESGDAAIFRLNEHTKRLFESAKILGMTISYTQNQINEAIIKVLRENKLRGAYIRPLVFYGTDKMGVPPPEKTEVIIAAWPWGSYLGKDAMTKGVRIKTSSFTRHHVNITMCKAKASCNYANSILAVTEAQKDGYDEALLLDVEGYVCEGSGENFFIVKNGAIYTPDLTSALNGITRNSVIKIAKDEFGLNVTEKRITRDEVYIADEAFFTGTAAEVTPIRELDHKSIGNGTRGTITQKLQKFFFETVKGKHPKYSSWLTHF